MQPLIRAAIIAATSVRSTSAFCQALVRGLAGPSVVLARIWLIDEARDLRLVASAGVPTGGGIYNRLDGEFGLIASGAGKIGRIAATRAPFVVRGIRGDEDWIANPGWVARQGVRAFLGYPLIAGADAVGVIAVFNRTLPSDGVLEDLAFLADYTAARLIDLREREAIPPSAPSSSAVARAPFPASFGETSPERPEGRAGGPSAPSAPPAPTAPLSPAIVTRAELRAFEKQTIEAALAATNGKVFGPRGAAALLGMKPTTLASRIKALKLR